MRKLSFNEDILHTDGRTHTHTSTHAEPHSFEPECIGVCKSMGGGVYQRVAGNQEKTVKFNLSLS